jgi:hypothetical protein
MGHGWWKWELAVSFFSFALGLGLDLGISRFPFFFVSSFAYKV